MMCALGMNYDGYNLDVQRHTVENVTALII